MRKRFTTFLIMYSTGVFLGGLVFGIAIGSSYFGHKPDTTLSIVIFFVALLITLLIIFAPTPE